MTSNIAILSDNLLCIHVHRNCMLSISSHYIIFIHCLILRLNVILCWEYISFFSKISRLKVWLFIYHLSIYLDTYVVDMLAQTMKLRVRSSMERMPFQLLWWNFLKYLITINKIYHILFMVYPSTYILKWLISETNYAIRIFVLIRQNELFASFLWTIHKIFNFIECRNWIFVDFTRLILIWLERFQLFFSNLLLNLSQLNIWLIILIDCGYLLIIGR